jgi:hypothetical protein
MICSLCHENKQIAYNDWIPGTTKPSQRGFSLNLCIDCLQFIGWKSEANEWIISSKICIDCGKRFIPKKESSIARCGLCWFKRLGGKNGTH